MSFDSKLNLLAKPPEALEFSEQMTSPDFIRLATLKAKKMFPGQDLQAYRGNDKYSYFPVLDYFDQSTDYRC